MLARSVVRPRCRIAAASSFPKVVFPAAVRQSIATGSRLEDRRQTLSAISLINRLRAAEIDDGSGWRHVETDSKELTVPFSRFPETVLKVPESVSVG